MNPKYQKSLEWLKRAKKVIPSASQTYSKGYKYYCEGAAPAFLDRGEGAHVWDIDGNKYIDTVMALGAVILGYNDAKLNQAIQKQLKKGMGFTLPTTLEVELAEKLKEIIPCAEMSRFVKNGSDATSASVRLARAYTGRDLILSAGYHGWHDWCIGVTENNRGIPEAVKNLTIQFHYNHIDELKKLLESNRGKVAAVILEPVELEFPEKNYLENVRELTKKHGALLVYDEVVTGFRFSLGGAQSYFKVIPDLACFGKAFANGADLSALVGRADIMRLIDDGTFISMTFGGNTLPLVSALQTIQILEQPGIYERFWKLEEKLISGIDALLKKHKLTHIGYTCRFPAHSALLFKNVNEKLGALDLQSLFQQEALKEGVLYLGIHNLCLALTEKDIQTILSAYDIALGKLAKSVTENSVERKLEGKKIRPVFARN